MTVYVNGVISNDLTPERDYVEVTGTKKDVVYGAFTGNVDGVGNTLTPNDVIQGNGKTVVNLTVSNWGGPYSTLPLVLPGVEVSGVKALKVKNLQSPTTAPTNANLTLDATNWGTALERVSTSGSGNMFFSVSNMTVGAKLNVEALGANQKIAVSNALYGDAVVGVTLSNLNTDDTTARAIANGTDIVARAGAGDSAAITYADSTHESVGAVTLGKLKASSVTGTATQQAFTSSVAATWAATSVKDATVGNATISTIEVKGGDSSVAVEQSANSNAAGNAGVGSLSVGSVSMQATDVVDGAGQVIITRSATATAGKVAAVGSTTIGNVTATNAGGDLKFALSVGTTVGGGLGGKDNVIGAVKVGTMNFASVGGGADVLVSAIAANGSFAGADIGDASISVGPKAGGAEIAKLNLNFDAAGAVGGVTVGNLKAVTAPGVLTPVATTAGTIDSFGLFVRGGSVGDVKVGNFTLDAAGAVGNSSLTDEIGVKVISTAGDIKSVAVGNLDIDGRGADFTNSSNKVGISAQSFGSIGASKVGSIDLSSNSTVSVDAAFTAGSSLGALTFGAVNVVAEGKGAGTTAAVNIDATAAGAFAGLTIGDVSLTGKGDATNLVSSAQLTVDVVAAANKAGDITIGKMSLTGIDGGANGGLKDIVVDINTTGAVTKTSGVGNIKIGDIALKAVQTGSGVVKAGVTLDTTQTGNIVIGNISVEGKGGNTDNFGTFNNSGSGWLTATVTQGGASSADKGTVTIGSVDYSAYLGAATIDVSGFNGAALIKGAIGASAITGNTAKNVIELYAGTTTVPGANDTVFFLATEPDNIDTALADVIKGFDGKGTSTAGDKVSIATTGYTNPSTTVTAYVSTTTVQSYQQFLTEAAAYLNNSLNPNVGAYVQVLNGQNLVAVDQDNNGAVDYVFTVETSTGGVFDQSDFAFT